MLGGGSSPEVDKHPIQRGGRNTPSGFVLRKQEISAGLTGH